MFQTKKCGSSPEKIDQIKFPPDTMPGEAEEYKSFSEVYALKLNSAAKTAK